MSRRSPSAGALLAALILASSLSLAGAAPYLPLPSWEGASPDLNTPLWPLSPLSERIAAPSAGDFLPEVSEAPQKEGPIDPLAPVPMKGDGIVYEMRRPLEVLDGSAIRPEDRMLERGTRQGAHLPDYFANPPQSFLVNPQHLLSEPQQEVISRFLEHHASYSKIEIYTLVFDVGQESSGGANLDNSAATWFPDRDALVVAYFLGNPEATQLGRSPGLMKRLDDARLEEVRKGAVEDALQLADHVDQLDRFSGKTSHLLFWFEREEKEALEKIALQQTASDELAAAEAAEAARMPRPLRLALLMGLPGFALGGGAFLFMRNRREEQLAGEVLYFGTLPGAKRLGAPYSGGHMVQMSFSGTETPD